MKKLLLSGFSILSLISLIALRPADQTVYICKGPYSERYHLKKDCPGLSNCSMDIYKVTLTEARNIKRTLCKRED